MSAAFDIVNRVGVGVNLIVVAVVILQRDIDDDVGVEVGVRRWCFAVEADRLFVDDVFVLIEELDVFGDAILEDEVRGLVDALVNECDVNAGIQEGEFTQAFAE